MGNKIFDKLNALQVQMSKPIPKDTVSDTHTNQQIKSLQEQLHHIQEQTKTGTSGGKG